MALASGNYVAKIGRRVVVWPAPDQNGDGELVWEDETDSSGQRVGRHVVKDKHGNEVRYYHAPEGFANRPSFDHTDNWVKVDDRGAIERQPNGEAISIKPGQALVFEPDNSVSLLRDEYAQYVFSQAHDETHDETDESFEDTPKKTTPKKVK